MAIQLGTNFEVLTSLPLDSRNLMSKAEMLAANDNLFPAYFLTQCSDENGTLYVYDKSATANAETGKFSPLADSFSPNIQVTALPTAGADEVGKIYQYIGATDTDTGLIKGCWYIGTGNADDGYSFENILVEPALVLSEITDDTDPNFIEGSLKTITLKQGDKLVGKFGINKDLVVNEGYVQKITVAKTDPDDDSTWVYTIVDSDPTATYSKADVADDTSDYYKYPTDEGTFIVLGIANQSYPIFINAKSVVSDKLGTVTEDVTANCAVGAMEVGDIIAEGSDITEVVKKLLIKYYAPVITLTSTPAGKVVENGETVSVTLSAAATKKSEKITGVSFYQGTTELETITTDVENGGTFTPTAGAIDITETTTFKATVTDGKKTNESKVTYTFVNPFYWGVGATTSVDASTLTKVIEEKGKKAYTYTGNNEYCYFAYDSTYGNLKSILDASSFENLSSFTKTTQTINGVTYNVYCGNSGLTGSMKYTFIF